MSHTPGPWKVKAVRHGDEVVGYNVDAERHDPAHSSEFPYYCIEHVADAHLIAAAPELLQAIKLLVHTHDMLTAWAGKSDPPSIALARVVIAKAEGR